MKKLYLLFSLLWLFLFTSTGYGYDRYIYSAISSDGDKYYVDSASILRISNPEAIRYWVRVLISEAGRRARVSEAKSKEQRAKLSRLVEIKICNDIIFDKNMARVVEEIGYDAKGYILYSIQPQLYTSMGWSNIPPGTIIESERDTVMRILRGDIPSNSQYPLSNQELREDYGKLLEYLSWLIAQPDYPEFDAWVTQKAQQHGLSPSLFSAGLQAYIRKSGGKYSDIRAMLASWYREFYMERYGSK